MAYYNIDKASTIKRIKNELSEEFKEFIDKHPDKPWSWFCNSYNTLNYKRRYEEKIKENLMAFRIQCHWRKCYYDPDYTICKRKLYRFFNNDYQ